MQAIDRPIASRYPVLLSDRAGRQKEKKNNHQQKGKSQPWTVVAAEKEPNLPISR
jgi:hypothetical protein